MCQDRRCFSPTTGHLLDCNFWVTLGLVVGRMDNLMRLYKNNRKTLLLKFPTRLSMLPISDMKKKTRNIYTKMILKNPYSNVTYRGCFQITSVPNEGRSGESIDRCHTQVLICTWPGWFIGCLRDVIQSFESNSVGKNIELYQSTLRPHLIIFREHFVFIKFQNDLCKFGDICTRKVILPIASQAFIIILILTTLGNSIIVIIFVVIIIQKHT